MLSFKWRAMGCRSANPQWAWLKPYLYITKKSFSQYCSAAFVRVPLTNSVCHAPDWTEIEAMALNFTVIGSLFTAIAAVLLQYPLFATLFAFLSVFALAVAVLNAGNVHDNEAADNLAAVAPRGGGATLRTVLIQERSSRTAKAIARERIFATIDGRRVLRQFERFGHDPPRRRMRAGPARDQAPRTMNMMPLTIAADVPIWLGFTTSAAESEQAASPAYPLEPPDEAQSHYRHS